MSRLTIDITSQQHQNLKALAALQGKTIKQFALERLFPADASGDQVVQGKGHKRLAKDGNQRLGKNPR